VAKSKIPGAASARYDREPPTGTRSGKSQPRGKRGTDDWQYTLDDDKRHGEQGPYTAFYTDRSDLIEEAQRQIENVIDKHSAEVQPMKYKRIEYAPLANQFEYESRPGGREVGDREPSERAFRGPSNQGARRQKKA
jgi:hypothetical protein